MATSSQLTRRRTPATLEDLLRSWLNGAQRLMLLANLRAPGRRITAPELSSAAGHTGQRFANRWYGQVGRWLVENGFATVDRWDSQGRPIYTSALARDVTQPGEGVNRVWELRPQVAAALERALLAP